MKQRREEVIVPRARVVSLRASSTRTKRGGSGLLIEAAGLAGGHGPFLLFDECITSQLGSGVSLVRPVGRMHVGWPTAIPSRAGPRTRASAEPRGRSEILDAKVFRPFQTA